MSLLLFISLSTQCGNSWIDPRMYILLTQARVVTYYMADPSSRQGGCPTTNKIGTGLTIAKIW